MKLPQHSSIISAFAPDSDIDGATKNGAFVRLAPFTNCCVIAQTKLSASTETTDFSIQQSTDSIGTSEKVVPLLQGWRQADSLIATSLSLITIAAGVLPTTGVTTRQVLILDFSWEDLDYANGFDWFRMRLTDPSTGVPTMSATGLYILYGATAAYGNNPEASMSV